MVDHGLGLLANVAGLQFNKLGSGLHLHQAFEVRQAEFGVGAHRVDRAQTEGNASVLHGLERVLHRGLRLFGRGLHATIGVLGLTRHLVGVLAVHVRDLVGIKGRESKHIGLGRAGLDRRVGGGLSGLGGRHGGVLVLIAVRLGWIGTADAALVIVHIAHPIVHCNIIVAMQQIIFVEHDCLDGLALAKSRRGHRSPVEDVPPPFSPDLCAATTGALENRRVECPL